MNFDTLIEITEYIKTQNSVFYLEDLQKYLRKKGCRASKDDLKECLYSFDSVFPLVNGGFISRAAVFTNKYFSFQPSKEEVEKGSFVIGHRCMPFVNSEVPPDSIVVTNDGKVLDSHPQTYSLNLAFDVFALYGEGYVIPYVFNDKANDKIKQSVEMLIFNLNIAYAARGGQVPFTSVGLEFTVPDFLKNEPAYGPGGKVVGVYGDYEKEVRLLQRALRL